MYSENKSENELRACYALTGREYLLNYALERERTAVISQVNEVLE